MKLFKTLYKRNVSNGILFTQIDLAAKLYPCFSLTNIFLLVETHAYNTS